MNTFSDRPIRKFNPGTFQSDDELIEQFVVRKHELEIALEILRGNIESPSCQHFLVVAPRGRGKTMLLARAAAELRTDDKLSKYLLPVQFMEESQEVFNLADFWLETLFHLSRESIRLDPVISRELRDRHTALTDRWHEQEIEEHAHAAVLEAADRLDKRLVLMVENLQGLCENVDKDFGWKLRAVLQSEPQIMLLASATSRFRGLDDVNEPFFELFRIMDLEPLTTEECRRLWQLLSGDTEIGRQIRPLQILTGGSPRLLIIVAGFALHRSLRQLMEELVRLIDEHTEYFRGHLEPLGKTERRVYLAVIDLWQPSSTGEIASRARMDVRKVSTMLGRLIRRGVVTLDPDSSRGKKHYVATERLYSIYYKLRRERDEAAVVRNLIHFMAVFYSEDELADMSGKLLAEAERWPVIREGIERAVAEQPQLAKLFFSKPAGIDAKKESRFFEEVMSALQKKEFEKVIEIAERILASQSTKRSRVPEQFIARTYLLKGTAHGELKDFEESVVAFNEAIKYFGTNDANGIAIALACKGMANSDLGGFKEAIESFDEVVTRFGTSKAVNLQYPIALALVSKGKAQVKLGNIEAAIATFNEVNKRFDANIVPEIQSQVATALTQMVIAQTQLADPDTAIAAFDKLIERFGDSKIPEIQRLVSNALHHIGNSRTRFADPDTVIAVFDKLIERFGDSKALWHQSLFAMGLFEKGMAQTVHRNAQEGITSFNEVVNRFGDSKAQRLQLEVAKALSIKGRLQVDIGSADEILQTCEELEQRLDKIPDNMKIGFTWRLLWMRTKGLLAKEKLGTAMDTFHSVYNSFVPNDDMMIGHMIEIVIDLITSGTSERDLLKILSSDKAKSDKLLPLLVAVRQRAGEQVRAPAEILEVAADIQKRIKAREAKDTSVVS